MKYILTLFTLSALVCSCSSLDKSNSGKANALVHKYMEVHFVDDSYQDEVSSGPDSVFTSLDSIFVYGEYEAKVKDYKFSGYKLSYSFKQKGLDGELFPHNWTFYFNKPLNSIHHIDKD